MYPADLLNAAMRITKRWCKQRKAEERSVRARRNRHQQLGRARICQKDAAWDVIPRAYAKASDNGQLPAHARQVFYAARHEIQELTGKPLDSVYFTQHLLPAFLNEHAETADWWVVYDARGHLSEPHTGKVVPLGTLEVEDYLRSIRTWSVDILPPLSYATSDLLTRGPKNRYSAILFIEKEGFNPLFERVQLAERYDLAIMSTKGQSVVAARRLIDQLCPSGGEVPILVLHDFDKQGFSIAENLTRVSRAAEASDRVRYAFENEINVIDLGLRLEDVKRWNLQAEYAAFRGDFDEDSITTSEERKFLRSNKRVELNAFTSREFITWIEAKLEEYGIVKVVPDDAVLERAYQRALEIEFVNSHLQRVQRQAAKLARRHGIPTDLAERVRQVLQGDSRLAWDQALARIVREEGASTDSARRDFSPACAA